MASTIIQDSITVKQNEIPEYINIKVELFHSGTPEAYFNIETELLKELPANVLIILKIEKLNPNKNIYEPTPLSIEKNYCSYMKMDKIVYPLIVRKGNYPKKCPVLPGKYRVNNFTVTSEDIPMSVPLGTYKLIFAYSYQDKKVEIIWTGRSV